MALTLRVGLRQGVINPLNFGYWYRLPNRRLSLEM